MKNYAKKLVGKNQRQYNPLRHYEGSTGFQTHKATKKHFAIDNSLDKENMTLPDVRDNIQNGKFSF